MKKRVWICPHRQWSWRSSPWSWRAQAGIAAVNFARNAGAVDGKSAVSSTSSLRRAAGKLVATKPSGFFRGRIFAKFLELNGLA